MIDNKADLKEIVSKIQIIDSTTFYNNGQLNKIEFTEYVTDKFLLKEKLADILYSEYYTRPNKTQFAHQAKTESDMIITEQFESFTFDEGWQISENGDGEMYIINKGSYKRIVYPGEFIKSGIDTGNIQVGDKIKLLKNLRNYDSKISPYIYYIGKTKNNENLSQIVRLYFNVKFDCAKNLAELINTELDSYAIPHSLKFLNHKINFNRVDSLVLYLDKRYFDISLRILNENKSYIQTTLYHEIPMFTKKLFPGIAFAENPFNENESFGTLRCSLIADAMVDAFFNKVEQSNNFSFVINSIKSKHYNPDAFYLNPNSKYPYNFKILDS